MSATYGFRYMIVNDADIVLGEGTLCMEVRQSAESMIIQLEALLLWLASPRDGMAQQLTLFDAAYRHFTRWQKCPIPNAWPPNTWASSGFRWQWVGISIGCHPAPSADIVVWQPPVDVEEQRCGQAREGACGRGRGS